MARHQFAPGIQDILGREINIHILLIGADQDAEKLPPAFRADTGDIAGHAGGIQMRGGQRLLADGNDADALAGRQGCLHPWHLHQR